MGDGYVEFLPAVSERAQYVADHTLGFIKKCTTSLSQFYAARRAAKQGEADSKRRTCSLTADCEMLSRAAALVKQSFAPWLPKAHFQFREIPRTAPSHFQISHIARLRMASRAGHANPASQR